MQILMRIFLEKFQLGLKFLVGKFVPFDSSFSFFLRANTQKKEKSLFFIPLDRSDGDWPSGDFINVKNLIWDTERESRRRFSLVQTFAIIPHLSSCYQFHAFREISNILF